MTRAAFEDAVSAAEPSAKQAEPLSVTVVVCVHNRPEAILKCLESLRRQSYTRLTTIVVDDGSTDNTLQVARDFQSRHPEMQLVIRSTGKNVGLSQARNVGIAEACSDLIFFTDSDCQADTDWVAELARVFESPTVVAAAGVSIDHEPRNYAELAYTGQTLLSASPLQGRRLVGNNMGFRLEALRKYQFDPALTYYCDEDDLAWRLGQDGHAIGFSSKAVVHHDHPMTVSKYLALAKWQGQGSAKHWFKKRTFLGRDVVLCLLAVLTLPMCLLGSWLGLTPLAFFTLHLLALVYNQWAFKGKPLWVALAVLPIEALYSFRKCFSVCATLLRIAFGLEPKIVSSARQWWIERRSGPRHAAV
jgi:GT2 family glycosyltransferase